MAHLQQVDVGDLLALQQQFLDRPFRVALEHGAELSVTEQPDHGGVVHVVLGQWRPRIGLGRVQDIELGRAQRQSLACARQPVDPRPFSACQRHEACVRRIRVVAARVEHRADLIALQHRHQPGHVVLVRVGEHHDVDAPLPEGQPLAQAAQH